MNNHQWAEFSLSDFFILEKGNQNNMASLSDGLLPLVSARKCDNGYKQFVSPNKKHLYQANIITLNNDGDGGAGIAYYQPHQMALDSHVTALIPKLQLNKFHLLFVSRCITKQRERFGHGYSLNSTRLRIFKYMLPITEQGQPDWQFMEDYMKGVEQEILKPTIDKLCKQLIYNQIGGGYGIVTFSITNGKSSHLPISLPIFNEVNGLKRQIMRLGIFLTFPQQLKTMASMDSLETLVA